ncbi:DUF4294 domain-containing protein [Prevotella sp. oral taxon 376]|uniref:DUF4294 domain-containing protein n=1 Tax=Prevotella sp. oral taxon 376 TaxID=712466 RepID=UPI000D1E6F01|nr:DUF4294 domain-containing protein [Prevotella sp. oral taxon 376]PTL33798.1 DUF4294 domain-containing protein [Prevotella sp. oral taxon 376]
MHQVRTILATIFLFCLTIQTGAQNTQPGYVNPEDRSVKTESPSFEPMVKVGKVLHNGDSIQYVELNNIYVYPPPLFKNEAQETRYNRLVYNVKKVLPIAKEVSTIVIETGDYLNTLPNEEARKKHMKFVEKSIMKEYTPRMKKLTYQQGKLLIKLVYRECGSSSYNLIQAFFGSARAGLYQGVAWFFGASLMKQYEPNGIDRLTERVVRQVESGQI